MAWNKTAADRARDAQVYGPEYRKNRPLAIRRAGGSCEHLENGRRCGSRERVQVDHITPVTQGGTHHLDNLRVLCRRCHQRKTAQEGGGYRQKGHRKAAGDPVLTRRTNW